MLNLQDRQFNRKVDEAQRISSFRTKVMATFGACILIGLLISLALFIGSVRAAEKLVQHFNP